MNCATMHVLLSYILTAYTHAIAPMSTAAAMQVDMAIYCSFTSSGSSGGPTGPLLDEESNQRPVEDIGRN